MQEEITLTVTRPQANQSARSATVLQCDQRAVEFAVQAVLREVQVFTQQQANGAGGRLLGAAEGVGGQLVGEEAGVDAVRRRHRHLDRAVLQLGEQLRIESEGLAVFKDEAVPHDFARRDRADFDGESALNGFGARGDFDRDGRCAREFTGFQAQRHCLLAFGVEVKGHAAGAFGQRQTFAKAEAQVCRQSHFLRVGQQQAHVDFITRREEARQEEVGHNRIADL